MRDGFEERTIVTPRGDMYALVGGSGPPVVLLHGYPETHLMWSTVAPRLAEGRTVVALDLPGYGRSFRPPTTADHAAHSKRAMASDVVAAMDALGHDGAFDVVGHDRGARVGYRLALDAADRVRRLAVIDIVPTAEVWASADASFAINYWHWSFLARPAPLPEALIAAAPDAFFSHGGALGVPTDEPCVAHRHRALFYDYETIHAMCEDYRAGASIDREHDEQDRAAGTRIRTPLLALWGRRGYVEQAYDVLGVWRRWADDVRGHAIDATHFVPEDDPDAVLDAIVPFLGEPLRPGTREPT